MADNKQKGRPAAKNGVNSGKADPQVGAKTNINLLDQKINTLGIELAKTHLHIDRMENNMMTALRGFKSEILSAIDSFAAEAQAYRNRDALRGGKIMEHETKLSDHENRLTTLETK